MSLRLLAERDLITISRDVDGGFAWEIVLTAPDGFASLDPLMGFSQDVMQTIDPETGLLVTGRLASVSIPIKSITESGYFGLPRGIADTAGHPWRVTFNDLSGAAHTFKVFESKPDRTLGNIVLLLEAYKA